MTAKVVDFATARRRKEQKGETMHLVGQMLPCGGRECVFCHDHFHEDDLGEGHRFTVDEETFAKHSFPCTDVLIKD